MSEAVNDLSARGQSIWLDFIRRAFLENGGLNRYISEGWITGLTSNPTIFAKAIAGSSDYDQALADIAGSGVTEILAHNFRLVFCRLGHFRKGVTRLALHLKQVLVLEQDGQINIDGRFVRTLPPVTFGQSGIDAGENIVDLC